MNPASKEDLQTELDEIHSRYAKRTERGTASWKLRYYERMRAERDVVFRATLQQRFSSLADVSCIEVGAGRGENLPLFHSIGIPWKHIHANELLEHRAEELGARFPEVTVLPGNALDISGEKFDVVLISAVFSSILDQDFRCDLARHLLTLLKDGGCILWHDFCYQNPFNRDVSGITEPQLRELFCDSSHIEAKRITLTPPVALLAGPLYSCFSWVPFLKSHLVAVIDRPA